MMERHANRTFLQEPESSFGGIQAADRVQEALLGRMTSNGKSPAAVCAKNMFYMYVMRQL